MKITYAGICVEYFSVISVIKLSPNLRATPQRHSAVAPSVSGNRRSLEGLLQKAQIQAVEAQAAATRQQAAASKAQAAATNQQSSISLMLQGLQMLQPTQTQSSFNTTCTWMGNFMNCW